MARPRLRTDDELLDAAARAMARSGPSRFTLALAAREAGIAPATLVLRFGSKDRLIEAVISRAARPESEGRARAARGAEAVIELAVQWAAGFGTGENLGEHVQWLAEDIRNPKLRRLVRRQFAERRDQIAGRLPRGIRDPETAARLIDAAWHGIVIQWSVERQGSLAAAMRTGLAPLLRLMEKGAP